MSNWSVYLCMNFMFAIRGFITNALEFTKAIERNLMHVQEYGDRMIAKGLRKDICNIT